MKRSLSIKLALSLTLASLIAPGAAWPQEYLSPGYILSEIQQGMGFYKVPEAPGFVKQGRPDPSTLNYQPLKPPPRDFHSEVNKPASRLEAEAPVISELETARAKDQARAAAAGAQQPRAQAKPQALSSEDGPPPMTWKPWDTD